MPAFSKSEMDNRIAALRAKLSEARVDVAFLHTADNVFYTSGVPLLSEWGRPMWSILFTEGPGAVCGAAIELENMEQNSALDEVLCYNDDESVVQASLRLCADYIARHGSGKIRLGIEEELLSVGLQRSLRDHFPQAELVEIGHLVADLRLVKSREEIEILELGATVAKIGADAFLEALHENATELAVGAHALAAVNKAIGALSINGLTSSYVYAQFGDNTMIPHLHPTSRRLQRGDLVSLNIFPVVWGYCAELERTFVYGDADDKFLKPLEAVNIAFDAGKEALRPGVKMSEIDNLTRGILREHELDRYIRHGTGHAHGIMIGAAGREERGELRSYNETLLAANMANSVEPGVYIPGVGGFRHSDVLIVTETGSRCITDFPRDIGV